jgi:hypothetical protein
MMTDLRDMTPEELITALDSPLTRSIPWDDLRDEILRRLRREAAMTEKANFIQQWNRGTAGGDVAGNILTAAYIAEDRRVNDD